MMDYKFLSGILLIIGLFLITNPQVSLTGSVIGININNSFSQSLGFIFLIFSFLGVSIEKKVQSKNIDKYKHMNYASYLEFFESGHLAFLKSKGYGFAELEDRRGLRTLVRHIDINYLNELHKGDKIFVHTTIQKFGRTSMIYRQSIIKGKKVCATADITIVFTDIYGNPKPIPKDIKKRLN